MDNDRKIALENTIRSHNYNKSLYDRNELNVTFVVGDYVFIDHSNKLNLNKLDEILIGLFPITRKLCNSVFKIDSGYGNFPKKIV